MDDRRWGNMCRLYPLVEIESALHCAVSRRRRRVDLCHSGLEVSFAQVQTIASRQMGSTSEKVHEVVWQQSERSRHVINVDLPYSVNALTVLKLPFPSMNIGKDDPVFSRIQVCYSINELLASGTFLTPTGRSRMDELGRAEVAVQCRLVVLACGGPS
jgi:hypothetical protein